MSSPTDRAPDGLLVSPELVEAARRESSALAETAFTMLDVRGAADMLGRSPDGVVELMTAGQLDGVFVGGIAYVPHVQVQRLVVEAAATGLRRSMTLRSQARAALRAFLADRPVTAVWEVCRTNQRPLVCARRGRTRVNYGIEYHSIVLRASWLSTFGAANRESFPELATLPVGSALYSALLEQPGVFPVRHCMPLAEGSVQHKLTGWVRIDARTWPVRVPADVAELVDSPR